MVLVNLRLKFHAHFLDNNSGINTFFLFPNLPVKTVWHQLCITPFSCHVVLKQTNKQTIQQFPNLKQHTATQATGPPKQKERCHQRRWKTEAVYLAQETLLPLPICRLRITTVTSNYFDAATKPINAILWCITQNISGKYKEHRETAVTNTIFLHSQWTQLASSKFSKQLNLSKHRL